jgi:ABC-type sugar transport system ATPase subunit
MATEADVALRDLGIELPTVELPVSLLSGGQRQAVAIARAVKWGRQVLLLDEPTAALGTRQTNIVKDLVRVVAAQGIAILIVSHDIPAVVEMAHRIIVMRQGAVVREFAAKTVTIAQIVGAMLGETSSQDGGVTSP